MRYRIGLLSLCALIAAAAVFFRGEPPSSGIFPVNPPTPYFHYVPANTIQGRVLVIHGLNANKQVMNVFCLALADAGFEVYSIDLPGHGASNAGFEAIRARAVVDAVLRELGGDITVIGHSLGAGLLVDLANDRDFKSMVLLSPPPTPVNRIRAERVLVFTGQFDLPKIKTFVPELEEGGAGSIDFRTAQWAGHTGAVFRADTIKQIVTWLGGDASRVRTDRRFAMVFGLLAWSVCTGIVLFPGKSIVGKAVNITPTIAGYVGALVAAVFLSSMFGWFAWLRLFATDYLISVVFLAGLGLAFLNTRVSVVPSALFQATLAAAYVIVVPGLLIGSDILRMTLSDGRWWRFVAITAAGLPLAIADESFIRPIRPFWKSAGAAVLTRAVLAGMIATGALTLDRSDAFIVLIIHLVLLFWVALWFAAELVQRRTQNPMATALFVSIVQAWIFAVMFVIV